MKLIWKLFEAILLGNIAFVRQYPTFYTKTHERVYISGEWFLFCWNMFDFINIKCQFNRLINFKYHECNEIVCDNGKTHLLLMIMSMSPTSEQYSSEDNFRAIIIVIF